MLTQEPDPSSPLGRLSLRARRVPIPIRLLFILAALGATGLCVVADAGPYQVVADAQAALFDGDHYPVISGALTFLVFALPAAVAIQLLAGLFPDDSPPPPQRYDTW